MLKYWQFLLYWFLKISFVGLIYALSRQQDFRGWLVMIWGDVLFTTISIFFLIILFFLFKKSLINIKINWTNKIIILLTILILNEISYSILFPENALREVTKNNNYTELIYKICDAIAVMLSGYLCIIIPIKNKNNNQQKGGGAKPLSK